MKVVILCGGQGTRMREETEYRPKPLVVVGEKPILWHIMKTYSHYGFNDFILCVGYRGYMIKEYFMNMKWLSNSFTINTSDTSKPVFHTNSDENWNVTIVDTGLLSETGKRIKLIKDYIEEDEFMLTYGDSLSDVNIKNLIDHHHKCNRVATLTGVKPNSQFGVFKIEDGFVTSFREKPVLNDRINGGYMVLNKKIFDYIDDTNCAFEGNTLHTLANTAQIAMYEHDGFWTAVDTYKDVERVNSLWSKQQAEWKIW